MFHNRVAFAVVRSVGSIGANARTNATARSVSNASSAAPRSTSTSWTSQPERVEPRAGAVEHSQHLGLDRQPAEIRAPGDTQAGQITAQFGQRTRPGHRARAESADPVR